MSDSTFRALIVEEVESQTFARRIGHKSTADLPPGDLLIRVHYSSLNYKDALSATGHRGVTRHYPHTPGIDAAGVVAQSTNPEFAEGDEVLVIGYDLGMNTSGGFGEYIRVPAGWVVKRPLGLSLRESMMYGTAGFAAALSVAKLQRAGIQPNSGDIAVTGATGGVGSLAVALLARAGYRVAAVTGKAEATPFLQQLGAAEVLARQELEETSQRPLLRGRWAGAVDTVGGPPLATLLKSMQYDGVVTCCGLVAGAQLETTVFPFILRGVSLLGVDAVECALETRHAIWGELATAWKLDQLEIMTREVTLEALDEEIERILQGQQTGRVVVKLAP